MSYAIIGFGKIGQALAKAFVSMSRLFDGLAIGIFDGLPATGSRVL
jgi:hypothetical protein